MTQEKSDETVQLSIQDFAQRLPKAELHVHWDGSFDTERLFFWAQKYADHLPES